MLKNLILMCSAAGLLGLTGCEFGGGSGGGGGTETPAPPVSANTIAVIDLDLVATRLGTDQQLQAALQQRQNQINQELNVMRQNFQNQVVQAQQVLNARVQQGQQISQAEIDGLQNDVAALNVQLQRAQATGQQTLNQTQIALIQQFRSQVRPVVQQIAVERGYSLVITKNEAVVYTYDQAHDITMEVVSRMSTPVVP